MELRHFMQVIWRRSPLIAFATIMVAGMTYALSVTSTPVYQAIATLDVDYGNDPRNDAYSSLLVSERSAKTYVEQLKSAQLARDVAAALGLDLSPEQLGQMVRVEQVRDTQMIKVSAESSSPELARDVANKVAELFIAQVKAKQDARYQSSKQELDAQIADLEKQIGDTQKAMAALGDPRDPKNANIPEFARIEQTRLQTVLSNLQTRYVTLLKSSEDFRLAAARYSDSITLFARAEVPNSPVRPLTLLNLLLGIISGLVLGLSAAFLLEYLDDTVKTGEQVSAILGVPALGYLMRLNKRDARELTAAALKDPYSPVAEAFRALRTNIQFSLVGRAGRTIQVTSAVSGEGKTTTVFNLAKAIAQTGKRVIAVDADLRRPSLHKLFGLKNDVGLTTVLLDSGALEAGALRPTGVENLQVLTSGPIPPNPSELLAAPVMASLIETLKASADLVLFDSPPLLAVADPSVLAGQVDAVLLVVDGAATRSQLLARAREVIEQACGPGKPLGAVLNKLNQKSPGYHYYHGYKYRYMGGTDSKNGRGDGAAARPVVDDVGHLKAK